MSRKKPLWTQTLILAALFGLSACSVKGEQPAGRSEPGPVPVRHDAAGPTGAVEGRVVLSGEVPALPKVKTSPAVERQCGAEVPDRSLVVGADGALQYAVVSVAEGGLDAAASGGEGPPAPVVDQKGCTYEPPVVAARAGSMLRVLNSDPLMHNVRASASATVFNVAMPVTGQRIEKALPATPGVVSLRCDVHPWMRATVKTFSHPFYAVTDAQGHFRIQGLPPGRHELVFWHERFPERRVSVEVPAGSTARQDLTWSAGELHGG